MQTHISEKLTHQERDLLKTMLYFDLFSYPLTVAEIHNCSRIKGLPLNECQRIVEKLSKNGYIFQKGDFWGIDPDHSYHERRVSGNLLAEKKLPQARHISQWIGAFPFVRAVFLSGSISKYFMTEESDIDYFIITEPRRLWIARTLLVLFKKIFLLNSHKYFCVNYFIDTEHLVIEEQNQFTATEIVHLIPTYGKEYYQPFVEANSWTKKYFPQFPSRFSPDIPGSKSGLLKRLGEILLGGKAGEWLDRFFMKKTVTYWNRKFDFMDRKEIDVALKSRTYVSKHHPQNFQKKVLDGLKKRISDFEEKHGIELN
ncbi:MAG: nucleotidyltransferase domain-containing protein [Bacteroidia bacterium]